MQKKSKLSVQIVNAQKRLRVSNLKLQRLAQLVFARYGIASGELDVLLVDDSAIRRLNRRFLGHDRPTDVIAFDGDLSTGAKKKSGRAFPKGKRVGKQPFILGDIVISLERAKKQAKMYRMSFEEEVFLYLIHGILHLLGYDDHSLAQRRRMELVQASILKEALGKLGKRR